MPGGWISRAASTAWPPRSPDLTSMDFFCLWNNVKNFIYQVKNYLQQSKAHIRDTVALVTHNMLQKTLTEAEYCPYIYCASRHAHTGIY
jgi:hypothetical protein